jgi:DNA-binding MarR family transcriptional regulator
MTRDFTDQLIDRWAALRPDLDPTALRVTARLSRLGGHMAQREEAVFGRIGLNRGEVGVLSALRMAGTPYRLSPTALGRGLLLSSAGVTSRLDRLERKGLVLRHPDPDDRRGVLVELTAKGLEQVDLAFGAKASSDRRLLAGLMSSRTCCGACWSVSTPPTSADPAGPAGRNRQRRGRVGVSGPPASCGPDRPGSVTSVEARRKDGRPMLLLIGLIALALLGILAERYGAESRDGFARPDDDRGRAERATWGPRPLR